MPEQHQQWCGGNDSDGDNGEDGDPSLNMSIRKKL